MLDITWLNILVILTASTDYIYMHLQHNYVYIARALGKLTRIYDSGMQLSIRQVLQ